MQTILSIVVSARSWRDSMTHQSKSSTRCSRQLCQYRPARQWLHSRSVLLLPSNSSTPLVRLSRWWHSKCYSSLSCRLNLRWRSQPCFKQCSQQHSSSFLNSSNLLPWCNNCKLQLSSKQTSKRLISKLKLSSSKLLSNKLLFSKLLFSKLLSNSKLYNSRLLSNSKPLHKLQQQSSSNSRLSHLWLWCLNSQLLPLSNSSWQRHNCLSSSPLLLPCKLPLSSSPSSSWANFLLCKHP